MKSRITQSRNSRSSHIEDIKLASRQICNLPTSPKPLKDRPAYATRSKTAVTRIRVKNISTFPALSELPKLEISPANKHEHHVHGEIFCYSTLTCDQDVNKQHDQQNNPLYAYKATRDPDTLYLHQAIKLKLGLKFCKAMQKLTTD